MRLALCLCISVVLLTACVGADPYSQIAAGQAALQATAVARSVAAESTRGAINSAALEQTRYAGEVLAVEAQIRGTEEAIAYQQTQIAMQSTRAAAEYQSTQSAATAAAINIQSTQNYIVQYGAAMSTATAIVVNQQIYATSAVRAANRASAIRWTGVLFLMGLAGCVLLAFLMLIDVLHRRGKAQADAIRLRERWLYERDAAQSPPQLPASPPGREEDSDDPKTNVVELLFAAANVVGKASERIPRHSDLPGFSAARWTDATNSLATSGAVIKVSRSGTYIRDKYRDIDGLYQAIMDGSLVLKPPSPSVRIY